MLAVALLASVAHALPPGFGGDVRLTNDPASSLFSRHAVDPSGNTYLAWQDTRDGNAEIYFAARDPNGGSLAADTRLTSEPALSWFPAIARLPSGNLLIAWMDDRDGNSEIYGTVVSSTGATVIDDTRLTVDAADSTLPAVAVGPNGNAAIAWAEGRDGNSEIYARIWNVNTGAFVAVTPESRLTNDLAISWQPAIAVDTANNAYVVWTDDRNGPDSDIFFTKVGPTGATVIDDTAITADTSDSSYPSVATGPTNEFHVAWTDADQFGNPETMYEVLSSTGATLVPVTRVSNNPSTSWFPTVTSDTSGYTHVSWIDGRSGNLEAFYAKRNASGAALVGETQLTTDLAETTLPALAADLYSTIRAIFADTRDGNEEIYFKRSLRPSITITGTPSGGNTLTLNLSAPLSPNQLYLAALSFGTTPNIPLGDGRSIDLALDPLFFLSLTDPFAISFGGSQGFLNAQGGAAATLPIPPGVPAGLTVHAAFVVVDTALTGVAAITEISLPASFTTQ